MAPNRRQEPQELLRVEEVLRWMGPLDHPDAHPGVRRELPGWRLLPRGRDLPGWRIAGRCLLRLLLLIAVVLGVGRYRLLDTGMKVMVVILAVLTAIGAAGVPGGSLPLMMLVMATVGVPPEGIAIVLGVDRILDMSRTTLNVCGDISASVYTDRIDRELEGLPPAQPGEDRSQRVDFD